MARAWSQTVPERQRKQAAWAFIKAAIDEYIDVLAQTSGAQIRVTAPAIAFPVSLDTPVVELARNIAREVAELPVAQACYQLSNTYTALLPSTVRRALGMYYTPPALTDRLLDMAVEAGIGWRRAASLIRHAGAARFFCR